MEHAACLSSLFILHLRWQEEKSRWNTERASATALNGCQQQLEGTEVTRITQHIAVPIYALIFLHPNTCYQQLPKLLITSPSTSACGHHPQEPTGEGDVSEQQHRPPASPRTAHAAPRPQRHRSGFPGAAVSSKLGSSLQTPHIKCLHSTLLWGFRVRTETGAARNGAHKETLLLLLRRCRQGRAAPGASAAAAPGYGRCQRHRSHQPGWGRRGAAAALLQHPESVPGDSLTCCLSEASTTGN